MQFSTEMNTLKSLEFVFHLGQYFGLLPFCIEGSHSMYVHFKWISFKTFYAFACLLLLILNVLIYLYNSFKTGVKFWNIGNYKK